MKYTALVTLTIIFLIDSCMANFHLGAMGGLFALADIPSGDQATAGTPIMKNAGINSTSSARISPETESAPSAMQQFTVSPIGRVTKEKGKTHIVLEKRYQPGLLGLDGFSHIYVYWWFDRNDTPKKREVLQVHPRGNPANPLTGVFATRSPCRPNLIGMTLCKIISVKENVIEIERIDAFADTPVLDIKPYIPRSDTVSNATVPKWLKKK